MNSTSEKRKFERFPIDIELELTGVDSNGNKFSDHPMTNDISGGGLSFLTEKSDHYYPGQVLKLVIVLPGTIDLRALMKTEATVVRKEIHEDSDLKGEHPGTTVSVKMNDPPNFERIDITKGNNI